MLRFNQLGNPIRGCLGVKLRARHLTSGYVNARGYFTYWLHVLGHAL